MKRSTIPANWYIEVTEDNFKIATIWHYDNADPKWHGDLIIGHFLLSEHWSDSSCYYGSGSALYLESKGYEKITDDQLQSLVEGIKEKNPFTTTISREAFESIYNVACSTWKDKLESWVSDQGLFKKEYQLTSEQVTSMFKAADAAQREVLFKAGLIHNDEINLRKSTININGQQYHNPLTKNEGSEQLISLRDSSNEKYDSKSYYLSSHFDWSLEKDGSIAVLVPKFKG